MGDADGVTGRGPAPAASSEEKTEAKSRLRRWLDDAGDFGTRRFDQHKDAPFADVVLRIVGRDRESAGVLTGSAIAFRLFLFFVPLTLFLVGIGGFVSGFVSAADATKAAGVSGGVAKEIRLAFSQPGTTRWVAVLLGFFGMVTTGRSLSRALFAASAVAWRLPITRRARCGWWARSPAWSAAWVSSPSW